jgi:regulator of protease activity HflC (stomatin/prohibitin superfamily)
MNCIERSVLAVALAVLPTAAWCGFTCKPVGSTTIYRDYLPAECKDVEIRELNPDGSLKRVIPAPLTEEQKKEKAAKERYRQACARQNKTQNDKDLALKTRYEHEEDLQEARYQALGNQLRRVDQANERMKEILKEGMDLSQQARFYDPPHQMPVDLKSNRDVNSRLEKDQLHVILDVVLNIPRINAAYDADLKRYRELMNRTAKMPCNAKE